MEELYIFKSNFKIDDKKIIEELKECKTGELLPIDNSGRFFNDTIEFEGQFLLLNDNDRYIVCYCDNEISLDSIDLDNSKFTIRNKPDRVIFILLNNNNFQNNLTIIFKNNERSNIDILKHIKQEKKIEIYFLSIVFGGFAKEKHKVFNLSQNEVDSINI